MTSTESLFCQRVSLRSRHHTPLLSFGLLLLGVGTFLLKSAFKMLLVCCVIVCVRKCVCHGGVSFHVIVRACPMPNHSLCTWELVVSCVENGTLPAQRLHSSIVITTASSSLCDCTVTAIEEAHRNALYRYGGRGGSLVLLCVVVDSFFVSQKFSQSNSSRLIVFGRSLLSIYTHPIHLWTRKSAETDREISSCVPSTVAWPIFFEN